MLRRRCRDESGVSIILVAVGLSGFLAATTLAIDVGMFMTARNQAQNSADAAALAGATALAFDSYTDRSASGPAVQNAVNAGLANTVMSKNVSLREDDVTFPLDETGQPNLVRVQVYRAAERGNPVATLMGKFFGVPTANITASATAAASPANAVGCVKPFMIPDRWIERQTPPWDPDDRFDMYTNQGALLPNPDVYVPADQPGYTGYDAMRDKGMTLTIRAGTGNNIEPTMYYSWKMPGNDIGGDFYRNNISGCNPTVVHRGDAMIQEPGDMSGPTMQGIDDLIAADPTAYWDDGTNSYHSTIHPSPRVFPIPLYDPAKYANAKMNGRTAEFEVANWLGFFVVSRQGNNVLGRITPILGIVDPNAGPPLPGAFPRAIRLVK